MCSFTPALLLLADPARPFMGRCVARPAVYLCVADCVENSHICRDWQIARAGFDDCLRRSPTSPPAKPSTLPGARGQPVSRAKLKRRTRAGLVGLCRGFWPGCSGEGRPHVLQVGEVGGHSSPRDHSSDTDAKTAQDGE